VLVVLPGLLAPLGCAGWQLNYPSMPVKRPAPTPSPVAPASITSKELSADQAAHLCLTTARRLEKKGYTTEAILLYERVRVYNPNLRTVSHRLAVLYDLQGETRRAEAEYRRALHEQPGNAEVHNDLGYFCYRHGRLKRAEEALRHAVALNPGCRCAWVNLGEMLAQEGRMEESYRAFARVLRPAEVCSNVGVLLVQQGRTREARGVLRQAVALDPTLAQPRAFLCILPASPGDTTLLPSIAPNTLPEPKEIELPSIAPNTLPEPKEIE
jgi:tetratricopeptide (TPR) repeat protein